MKTPVLGNTISCHMLSAQTYIRCVFYQPNFFFLKISGAKFPFKKMQKSKRNLWGTLHVKKKNSILITTALFSLYTILPFAKWRCDFYLKNMHVHIRTKRFALAQPRVVRFWGLSLLCQPRLLPTARLFPAALEHQIFDFSRLISPAFPLWWKLSYARCFRSDFEQNFLNYQNVKKRIFQAYTSSAFDF